MKCSTTTVTETVTRTFTESVEVIRTAQEQFNECYDRELAQPLCAALPYGKEACALAACSVTAFVSMVVGFIEVITTIAEEVTREAVNCASRTRGEWTSPWITNAPVKGISLARGAPAPDPEFTSKDIIAGVKLLRELPEIFGPFGTCMLAGEWSFDRLDALVSFLEGELTRPYGAKVCLAVDCAFSLANFGVLGELAHSWGKMFMVLTALSPQIRLAGAAFGLPNPDAVELADAASPAVVSAAAHVLGFIMMTLLHGQVVSMQIVHHKESEGFADGTFCIEHSSFALALLRMASLAVAPAALIPPIVTA